jgi:hypothetical protein
MKCNFCTNKLVRVSKYYSCDGKILLNDKILYQNGIKRTIFSGWIYVCFVCEINLIYHSKSRVKIINQFGSKLQHSIEQWNKLRILK